MSMLAERKRKQKWSLNPRGKHWSEDSNKFGQKLLEKMGWSAGKGLGAKEDGITEHIRVNHKSDSKGIGYKETDDQWTQHESNFSQLLNSLSGPKKDEDTGKETVLKLESLEKKSQNSRARVHYHKFTRGKDLSRYSEKDLANIFGKKSLKEDKCIKNEVGMEDNNENSITKTYGVETHNRGSMIDYFKKKMSYYKKYNVDSEIKSTGDKYESEEETPSFGFGFNVNGNENKMKSSFVSYIKENILDNGVVENGKLEKEKVFKKNRKLESIEEEIEENGEPKVEFPFKNNQKRKSENELELAFTPLRKKFKNFDSLNSLRDEEKMEITPTKKCKKKRSKKEINDNNPKRSTVREADENGIRNPAFDPTFNGVAVEKHLLEIIKEEDENVQEESPKNNLMEWEEIEQKPLKKNKKKRTNTTIGENNFEKHPLDVIEEEEDVQKDISMKKDKSKKKKLKAQKGIDNSCFEDFKEESSFLSIEGPSHIDESISAPNEEPKTKSKKLKKKKIVSECGIENSAFNDNIEESSAITKNFEDFELRKNTKKRKSVVIEDIVNSSNISNELKKKDKKKKDGKCTVNCEENIQTIQGSNEDLQDFQQKASKTKKRKKDQLVAMENPGFDPNDSTECQENNTSLYEVKRKKKDINLGIVNPGLDLTTPSPKKQKGKEVKPPLQLEMPVMDEEIMLNVVNTPVLKKKEGETSAQRRKSVRFSGVNQRIFMNNADSPADLRKKGTEGVDNEAFDELGNHIEENIDTLSKQLDDYQAQVENDINEAKVEVMVGEMGDPYGENEILPGGDVKLKFKYAQFGKTPPWLKRNGETRAKTSYRHLIKGDIILGFKNTNLHEIKGYGKIKQGDIV